MDTNSTTVLDTKRAELAALAERVEQAERLAWEKKTIARNPQLVLGSLRIATVEEAATLSHCHGEIAEIRCAYTGTNGECGETRIVNKQDAFQVRYCLEHKSESKKAARAAKSAVDANDPAKAQAAIARKMAALQAKLAKMEGVEEAVVEAVDTASAG
jgi:hypothetical protein